QSQQQSHTVNKVFSARPLWARSRRQRGERVRPLGANSGHSSPHYVFALLIHRLHHGADDPGKDRATACAAKRISEETAQGPSGSRIGTRSTSKEATKK